jgi:hypothetical protein
MIGGRMKSRVGYLLVAIIVFLAAACAHTAMDRLRNDPGALERVDAMAYQESLDLESLVQSLEYNDAVWAESDLQYYSCWLAGSVAECSGDLSTAIAAYSEGSKIDRYEIDNYEILLPLGRAYLRDDQTLRARITLENYIRRAEAYLIGDHPWILTEEGKLSIQADIATAQWLLTYTANSD